VFVRIQINYLNTFTKLKQIIAVKHNSLIPAIQCYMFRFNQTSPGITLQNKISKHVFAVRIVCKVDITCLLIFIKIVNISHAYNIIYSPVFFV